MNSSKLRGPTVGVPVPAASMPDTDSARGVLGSEPATEPAVEPPGVLAAELATEPCGRQAASAVECMECSSFWARDA